MLRDLKLTGLDLKVTAFHPQKADVNTQKSCLTLFLLAAVCQVSVLRRIALVFPRTRRNTISNSAIPLRSLFGFLLRGRLCQ